MVGVSVMDTRLLDPFSTAPSYFAYVSNSPVIIVAISRDFAANSELEPHTPHPCRLYNELEYDQNELENVHSMDWVSEDLHAFLDYSSLRSGTRSHRIIRSIRA